MKRPSLSDLNAFEAIAAHRSFRKAADALGLSPSTLSHMMRGLESAIGARLLHRTTRSVATTEAGERLLARLSLVLRDLDRALEEVGESQGRPSGTLRINANERAARLLLSTAVPVVLARHPEMAVDLVTDGKLVDIVASGFDAGVRLGEAVPRDMVAVRVGGPVRFLAVASPAYLGAHRAPLRTPDDLARHACIRIRMPSGKPYRWEFAKDRQELAIDVAGSLILDHIELMTECAVAGMGIAYVPSSSAERYLATGELVSVLEDWCPAIPGLYLYYPSGRYMRPGLRAFVDVVKELWPSDPAKPPRPRRTVR